MKFMHYSALVTYVAERGVDGLEFTHATRQVHNVIAFCSMRHELIPFSTVTKERARVIVFTLFPDPKCVLLLWTLKKGKSASGCESSLARGAYFHTSADLKAGCMNAKQTSSPSTEAV